MPFNTIFQGTVGRGQPVPLPETSIANTRLSRYGEVATVPGKRPYALADEGKYFVCNNGQAGILSTPATGWVATTPAAIIYNSDSPGNPAAVRLYLDYLALITTVVGSAASGLVNVQAALYVDSGNRYASGGTEITSGIVNPNMDAPPRNSVARVYFGALTASAAVAARAIAGLRIVRATVSGTVVDVVGEQKIFNFGGVEGVMNGSITIANANNIPVALPPVIIGPNQCALLYIWQNVGGTNVAATYAPEVAWYER